MIEWTTHLHDGSAKCPVPAHTLVRFLTNTSGVRADYYYDRMWQNRLAYQIGTVHKPEVVGCWGNGSSIQHCMVQSSHRIIVTLEIYGDDAKATGVKVEKL
jgi:hypothetical protein